MAKNLVSGLILAHLAQIRAANFLFFFFKNLASSVTRYPILRKLSDGQTDGQTDRRTRVIS